MVEKADECTGLDSLTEPVVEDAAEQETLLTRHLKQTVGALTVVTFFVLWQLASVFKWINPVFFSSPSRVLTAGYALFTTGEILPHLRVSLIELGWGLGLAVVVGVIIGVLYGWYPWVTAALEPFVSALNATPLVALLPMLIITLGIGIKSKIAVVFLMSVFSIIINTGSGMRTIDKGLLNVARAFGASDRRILLTIGLPSSLPFILAGIRLAVGRALVGVVVGEMYAATAGVGYVLSTAGESFQMSKFYALVVLMAIAGIALTRMIEMVENRFAQWRPERD
jgi:ABC-type nitrate/sulfonate/bicarbonate transport system permease component